MKDLVPIQPEKADAYSRIKKFVSIEESGITLLPKEEKMLRRWMVVQGFLSERKFSDEEIIDEVITLFDVSKFTARSDINYARSLFVEQLKNAKRFALYHHARQLEILYQQKTTDKAYAPYLHHLANAVTKAWAAVPEEQEVPDVPAPVLIMNVVNANTRPIADARKAADELIELERTKDYTEFEEIPDGS